MAAGRRVLKKEAEVAGGYDGKLYRSFRLWVPNPDDGAQVPVSVVHRSGSVKMDGSDPLLLYAYGAYGSAEDPDFDPDRLSLLNRCRTLPLA
jgi:oligopeptidase B